MKPLYLLLFLFITTSGSRAESTNNRFELINSFQQEYFQVALSLPTHYYAEYDKYTKIFIPNLSERRIFNISEMQKGKKHWSCHFAHWASAINRDCQSKILFPMLPAFTWFHTIDYYADGNGDVYKMAKIQYFNELRECIYSGYDKMTHPSSIDAKKYLIAQYGGKEARRWGNADSVYVVDFPMNTTFECRYTHCIGVYMAKKGFVPLYYKILMTDEAYAECDNILRRTKGCMAFCGEKWLHKKPSFKKALKELYNKIEF
ncbi:MAG: hypothetical protein ACI3YX_10265 [Prevotella sp.]